MKIPLCRLTGFVLILILALASTVQGQTASASAKASSPSVGTPSTFTIKQHFLAQQQARIQGEIREVRRCIANASNTQVVRDPEGNLNRVPQVDLIDCSRRLQQLTRQLQILTRSADRVSQDAAVASARASNLARGGTSKENSTYQYFEWAAARRLVKKKPIGWMRGRQFSFKEWYLSSPLVRQKVTRHLTESRSPAYAAIPRLGYPLRSTVWHPSRTNTLGSADTHTLYARLWSNQTSPDIVSQ